MTLPWYTITNAGVIKMPQDFLKDFITEYCKLKDPRTFDEHRYTEHREGRWGSDEVGFSYKNSWSSETSDIPEKYTLRATGILEFDFVWQYEQPHWSAWASNPDAGMENQTLRIWFESDDIQETFVEFFQEQTGQPPILTEYRGR
mgnify:CR=1 FL=1